MDINYFISKFSKKNISVRKIILDGILYSFYKDNQAAYEFENTSFEQLVPIFESFDSFRQHSTRSGKISIFCKNMKYWTTNIILDKLYSFILITYEKRIFLVIR